MAFPIVCVPMKLDAFVLNPSLCAPSPRSTVAPITQPNYSFLRLDSPLLQSDVLDPVDLHSAANPATNSRITDLGTGKTRERRIGVYLHWIMPRVYRTGTASTGYGVDREDEKKRRAQSGFPDQQGDDPDDQSPDFRATPDRWLIVRRLHLDTVQPASAVTDNLVSEFQGFVVESDRLRNIQDLGRDVDLEVDVSPFIKGSEDSIDVQAEIFIGLLNKDAPTWKESEDNIPRVPVGLLNSSNQLFADYVPHNGNVFSMLDRFEYTLADGTSAKLQAATASYHVIGWHSDRNVKDDPFHIVNGEYLSITHQTRLDGCKMAVVETPESKKDIEAWLKSGDSTRVLCHGSMYSVEFSSTSPPPVVLADKTAALFSKASPVAVGTNPLDSILSFVKAHLNVSHASSDPVEQRIFHDLVAIEKLLLKQEEDADSQAEATDMLSAHNFAPAQDSGSRWHLSGQNNQSGGAPTEPTPAQQAELAKLNALQAAVDEATRELRQSQWNLWSMWWTFVTALGAGTLDPENVKRLSGQIERLVGQIGTWQNEITKLAKPLPCEKGARDRFYALKDPTLLVSGVPSPWPSDFLNDLQVRLDFQLVGPQALPSDFTGWKTFPSFVDPPEGSPGKPGVIKILPVAMQKAAKGLLYEFFQLRPPDSDGDTYKPTIPTGAVLPLYHDADKTKTRDLWNRTQPWFPLFLEWEAEYFHIPYDKWAFESIIEEDVIGVKQTRMRYGVIPDSVLTDSDKRTIHGRVLILPQPTYSLAASIKTLLANTPIDILREAIPDDDERNSLPDAVSQLAFLSSPLSGFTDHLITRLQGTHIKPTRRRPGQIPKPLPSARRLGVGFNDAQITQMDVQTGATPYAQEVPFAKDTKFSPFKPVAHGQFRFTKMNLIDKFGQAVSAIDPAPARHPPPLYPAISEYYQPQLLSTGAPNTITVDPPGFCQYVRLPPNINQDARLNGVLLTRDPLTTSTPAPPWRPAKEWESPIWGWVVVNYIENGVQLFLPDGSFYREVRLGGVHGASTDVAWKPFGAPTKPETGTAQLDALLKQLADKVNLRSFIGALNHVMDALPEAPDQYAEFLSAIIGKPLDWSILGGRWNWPRLRFFNGAKNPTPTTGPPIGEEMDAKTMYTYFPQTPGDFTKDITPAQYLPLKPYKLEHVVDTDPAALQLNHNAQFSVVGAIVDPFMPLHGYSGGVVPIVPLSLPPWSVQSALKVMTAFFTMGPLVVTSPDMQDRYDPERRLTKDSDYSADVPDGSVGNVPPGKGVPIPALEAADWMWLQPYMQTKEGEPDVEWNPMGIEVLDNKAKFENAPYTATEGYLQLRKALDKAPPTVDK